MPFEAVPFQAVTGSGARGGYGPPRGGGREGCAVEAAEAVPDAVRDLLCTGPLVEPFGGAGLSRLVGLAVTTPVYYLWARNRGETAPAPNSAHHTNRRPPRNRHVGGAGAPAPAHAGQTARSTTPCGAPEAASGSASAAVTATTPVAFSSAGSPRMSTAYPSAATVPSTPHIPHSHFAP